MKKIFKKLLIASVAAGTFIFNSPLAGFNFVPTVYAEVKMYTGVGKCVQGDLITIEQAKNYARLRAEINAKEQAGVYLRGYSNAQNFNLTENKIEVITNSIINIVGDVQYKTETAMIGDSPVIRYIATLQANIDTEGINAYIRREDTDKLQSAQKEIIKNLDKIDNLIERYNRATSQAEKDKIRAELSQADRNILAAQKLGDGNDFYHQSKYQEAINFYNEAIKLNPNDADAYNGRGATYVNLKNYKQAIVDYNKAIKLNPKYARLYYNRGIVYSDLKQYDKAIADYSKAIKLNPYYYWAYNNRGITYNALQQYDKAISDYTKAIQIMPNDFGAYHNRGKVYYNLEQYDKAISDFNKAVELNPKFFQAYNSRGVVYGDLMQYDKAISDFNKAIELNQNFYLSYYNRGYSYYKLDEYNKAISDFNKTIELESNYARAYKNRGRCYQALGENEKTNADFAKAKELENKF